ncbi:MAG: TlpA disulfide reductase family protein, partial [Pseudomonadota bacterium]
MRTILLASAFAALAACGAPNASETLSETSNASNDAHADPSIDTAINEFRTTSMIDFATAAKTKKSGVPADDYGRPLSYRGLDAKIPDFTASIYGGGEASQETLAGKWTVVKFWGMWCGDCVKDAPYVAALTDALESDPGTNFLSIHTPPSAARMDEAMGKWGSLETYFADKGLSYPVAMDPDASLRDAFLIDWTPTYL